ncbi:TonB-dependent receptor [Mucilaginibacter sp. CSA2-8R]|uniref:TonB-dependent receptor n=1 Tax=Mucilaginibacter sp. CSA2-8R TaxID=3141542 RepID=UPI00315D81AB
MKLFLFFLIAIGWYNVAIGQTIAGRVVDEKQQPIVAATVSLLNGQDSVLQSLQTDGEGRYQFWYKSAGRCRLMASAIGFKMIKSAIIQHDAKPLVLPDFSLMPDLQQLGDVVVLGRKPFLEQRADKLIINVQSSVLAAGQTAADVLRRVPGMRVLSDRVTLTGKNKLVIMVEGRLSQYQDMNALLRATPANTIDRIEVITNPSAAYDAEGDAVINIILKHRQGAGTNATVGFASGADPYVLNEVKQGRKLYQRYNPSFSINHRDGKLNMFGSYNYLYRTQFEVNLIQRKHDNSYYDQRNYNPSDYDLHTYQAGADYQADSLNTFGVLINGFNRKGGGHYQNTSTQTSLANGNLLDAFTSQNRQSNINSNLAVNISWRHKFANDGQSLVVDADAAHYLLKNVSHILVYPQTGNVLHTCQSINNPVSFATLKADYTQPLSKTVKFETGLKTSLAKIDNNLLFEQNEIRDAGRTNRFIYRENINAAYGNFYSTIGKWDVQAGLRAEQTVSDGTSHGQKLLQRNFVKLFPDVLLTRRLDSALAITGQFSKRIGRPSYQQQNPFEMYLDPLTYTKGNPLLRPQITQSAKLSFTYTGLPVFSVAYDRTHHVIVEYAPQQKMVVDANGVARLVSFSVADNLAEAHNISFQLNFPIKAGKVIDGYGGIITALQQYSAYYNQGYFEAQKWGHVFFAQTDVRMSNSWTGQVSAYYATPSQYEFIKAGRNSSVDLGVAKKLMNNRAKVTLSVTDLFFGDRTLGNINYQDIDLRLKQYSNTRNIILAFTYNIGNQQIKAASSRTSGAEEEAKRVKTNN